MAKCNQLTSLPFKGLTALDNCGVYVYMQVNNCDKMRQSCYYGNKPSDIKELFQPESKLHHTTL